MEIDPQVLLGSLALSIVHAAIPSHWLPLVLVSRSERWSGAWTFGATALAGLAHTLSTILIGAGVGSFGARLAAEHGALLRWGMPSILALVGLAYLGVELRERGHHHHHDHGVSPEAVRGRGRWGALAALSAAMFLSPCLEIEAYFFVAGAQGLRAFATLAAIYLAVTVAGMVALVALGRAGLGKVNLRFLDRHEKGVVGVTMLALAALTALWA